MNHSRKYGFGVALLVLSIAFGACGYSEEEMQAKRDEITDLQAKLQQSDERGTDLEARLKEMTDKNNELMERLNIAGTEKAKRIELGEQR